MELSREIEKMQRLTEMTDRIENLQKEIDYLRTSRKLLMSEYAGDAHIGHLKAEETEDYKTVVTERNVLGKLLNKNPSGSPLESLFRLDKNLI